MIFRQLFDPQSSTYTYLLADRRSREALVIDPVFEHVRRDCALVHELEVNLVATLETHIHADHVTGAWLLKERCGSAIAVSAASDAQGADRYLAHGDRVAFGDRYVEVRATPGHTAGCVTFVLDDESMAFTGDCLLIRGSGRTDFQQGDARTMFRSVRSQILTLPPSCLLYPAHDYRGLTVTSVEEERRFNPRLGADVGESDFIGYMRNLGLPHPKQMDVAVPANLRCGRTDASAHAPIEATWAPLTYTFAGIFEITPQALEEHAASIQVLDVREHEEFDGALGRIRGALSIPLSDLTARAAQLSHDQPIVAVCRSGARSAQAVVLLARAGFSDVANLAGGMLRWRAEGHPVEGARE
ncbi:MAG TPA: rhodanese-like domain-containing protein [Casimicrobiaceae bacterium]|nr:rhodanese-like domain-containing protein [Casimicrobiaceae bacterium]